LAAVLGVRASRKAPFEKLSPATCPFLPARLGLAVPFTDFRDSGDSAFPESFIRICFRAEAQRKRFSLMNAFLSACLPCLSLVDAWGLLLEAEPHTPQCVDFFFFPPPRFPHFDCSNGVRFTSLTDWPVLPSTVCSR